MFLAVARSPWVNRVGRIDRPLAATLPACQSAAGPYRDADRAMQAGQATLGRAEDTPAAGPALSGVRTRATRCRRSSAAQARARRPRQPAEAAAPSKLFFVPRPRRRVCALLSGECAMAARHEP